MDHCGIVAKDWNSSINLSQTDEKNDVKNDDDNDDINSNEKENINQIITGDHLQQVFNSDLNLRALESNLNQNKIEERNRRNMTEKARKIVSQALANTKCLECIFSYFIGDLPMLGSLARVNLIFYGMSMKHNYLWEPIAKRCMLFLFIFVFFMFYTLLLVFY